MSTQLGFNSSEEFLKQSNKFKLGFLPTEQSHPDTWNLSEHAKNDLGKGIQSLKGLDENLLDVLSKKTDEAYSLSQDIQKVLNDNGRVFIFGCGATGRLSLLIESIWNKVAPDKKDQVVSFMSGGDIALVQSVEGFEDYTEYGARQLMDLGFKENDLLICSTEGGETPIVIGAAQKATEVSKHSTYYIYCNPTDLLVSNIERSKDIIEHNKITSVELFCGPMGVAGSTRMQASSVLQAFICLSLFYTDKVTMDVQLNQFQNFFENTDLNFLQKFIEKESGIYVSFNRLTYFVDPQIALNVFTDTTERAPTFSMKPFEHPEHLKAPLSLCYVCVDGATSSEDAWEKLLFRQPRPLNWSDETKRVSYDYLKGFDFSQKAIDARNSLSATDNKFYIKDKGGTINWTLNDLSYNINIDESFHDMWKQLFLKLILNIHSTLIMGRLNRYEHNLMTWVSPSNGKLIDRTVRYINYFLKETDIEVSYDDIVKEIFNINLQKDRSMVLEVVRSIKERHASI